jgi:hypothetical protein
MTPPTSPGQDADVDQLREAAVWNAKNSQDPEQHADPKTAKALGIVAGWASRNAKK